MSEITSVWDSNSVLDVISASLKTVPISHSKIGNSKIDLGVKSHFCKIEVLKILRTSSK